MIFGKVILVTTRHDIMTPHGNRLGSPRFSLVDPPVPGNDESNVEKVEGDHGDGLPKMQLTVSYETHAESSRHNKEANIADEALAGDVEGANQSHGAGDNGGDEARSANKLADGQTGGVGTECCKGGKDIRAAVSKGQQRDTRQTFAHAQHIGDGVEVDAEEVAGCDANGAEENAEPEGQEDECNGLRMGHAAVVKGQVGDDAGLLVGAVCEDKGAFVGGMVDEPALLVEYGQVPLGEEIRCRRGGGLAVERFYPCEQGDEGNGDEGEGKWPRRVACAPPFLHRVQYRGLVHGIVGAGMQAVRRPVAGTGVRNGASKVVVR